ncbi:hypothetical protein ACTPOK_40465 [Streptomyces inhibens]
MEKPPYVHFDGAQEIPFDVLKHFTALVATTLADEDTQRSDSD